MGGSAQLRLINTAALLRTAEGQRWNDPTRPEDEAGRQIGEQIGRQLNAVFSELMQRMIDDVKAPVPGQISGGPNKVMPWPATVEKVGADTPPAKFWLDETESADTNEIAIYWNSPAVFVGACLTN